MSYGDGILTNPRSEKLMDELRHRNVKTRLALAFSISCVSTGVLAADRDGHASQAAALRQFLQSGWNLPSAPPHSEPAQDPNGQTRQFVPLPEYERRYDPQPERLPADESGAASDAGVAEMSTPVPEQSLADVLRAQRGQAPQERSQVATPSAGAEATTVASNVFDVPARMPLPIHTRSQARSPEKPAIAQTVPTSPAAPVAPPPPENTTSLPIKDAVPEYSRKSDSLPPRRPTLARLPSPQIAKVPPRITKVTNLPPSLPAISDSPSTVEGLAFDDRLCEVPSVPSLESIHAPAAPSTLPALPTPSSSITLHTTRLMELSQQSLRKAQQSLQKGATHTARKYSVEAMQAVVAMHDAREGGNLHARQLDSAFDAIRESKDFCGEFGMIDSAALRRMVMAHETETLKDRELTTVSALEATESYLAHAKAQLVSAAGGIREGSQALALMGLVEFEIAEPSDNHSMSVAVTVQRAAVESDPSFAAGYQLLGTTLLNLGLIDEAADCVIRSLQIQPSRLAYEQLLEISRRLGDADTARICMQALQDPRMEEGSLVPSLEPSEFAAMHRPSMSAINSSRRSTNPEPAKAAAAPEARIGFRSLFSLGRK